ncbi:hypothetical protein NIES4075_06600 [Tolypothrix sp. NIES-4075]|nr:hypothetical protein NIES4075_06600 [Tolypothrix sp. NIES-4075]
MSTLRGYAYAQVILQKRQKDICIFGVADFMYKNDFM